MVDFNLLIKPRQTTLLDGYHFSKQQCDQLYDMILVDDDIHLDVELPKKLEFSYTQKQLMEGFYISRQVWCEGIMEPGFIEILRSLCYSCHLSKEERALYKKVRAKFKHLCYAYRAFDERHQRPYWLGKMTGILGKLQDGFKNQKTWIVRPRAFLLYHLWHDHGLWLLKREVDFFFPSNLRGFVSFLQKKTMIIAQELTTHRTVTAYQFHSLRKNISTIAATYGTLDVLFPSQYHHQLFQYLATINGLMGDYHDLLVEKKLNKTQSYYFDKFMLPERISTRLNRFIDHFSQIDTV